MEVHSYSTLIFIELLWYNNDYVFGIICVLFYFACRVVVEKWSGLIVQSRYGKLKNILALESNVLTGYIERKGTQLRLEKALMFTKQIQKVLLRWKSNDFYAQLMQFQKSIGNFDMTTGYLLSSKSNVSKERLPSSQWTRWVIYLALRDAALLAKVSFTIFEAARWYFLLRLIFCNTDKYTLRKYDQVLVWSHRCRSSLGRLSRCGCNFSSNLVSSFVAFVFLSLLYNCLSSCFLFII